MSMLLLCTHTYVPAVVGLSSVAGFSTFSSIPALAGVPTIACIPAFTVTVASLSLCCCVANVAGVYFAASAHALEKTLSNVIFTHFVVTFEIHKKGRFNMGLLV
jgi:hypothetical protein